MRPRHSPRRNCLAAVRAGVIALLMFSAETPLLPHPSQVIDALQQIPGTRLKVRLPANWRVEAAPKVLGQPLGQPYALRHTTPPEYALMVSQSTQVTRGHSCMSLIGSMQAIPSLRASVAPRPKFIPDIYFGSMLFIENAQLTCLSTGDGFISVMIYLAKGESKPDVIIEMLAAIADAAAEQAKTVTAPARLKLPLLGIDVPIRTDSWGISEISDNWGRNNVIGRVAKSHANELMITPFVLKAPGGCGLLMTGRPPGNQSYVILAKSRRYGGERWHPDAWEQFPPRFKELEAYACHNLGQDSILMARIEYERNSVTETDAVVIRQLLDDLGEAVDRKLAHSRKSVGFAKVVPRLRDCHHEVDRLISGKGIVKGP